MKLLVLDGNSIINRAFYGIKLLTTRDGHFTNGIVGFMNILQNLISVVSPDGVAAAFDLKAPTFRIYSARLPAPRVNRAMSAVLPRATAIRFSLWATEYR